MHGRLPDGRKTHVPLGVDIPVICIGNLNVGGTGKRPQQLQLHKC